MPQVAEKQERVRPIAAGGDTVMPLENEKPIVKIEGLVKTYGEKTSNPVHAVRGISFEVARGDFLAVMGHSGSGKSTLMNILGCLDKPTSGTYWLEGEDVSLRSRRQLARVRAKTLGFVFQSYHLLPRLSARANCELPLQYAGWITRRERRRRSEEALTRVGLSDKFDRKPTELSGGQQQRVAIARALVNEPSLLLADEPTGNLDTRTGLGILALLQELHADGLSIIMVTHEADVASCAGRAIHMRDGKIHKTEKNEQPKSASDELIKLGPEESSETTE